MANYFNRQWSVQIDQYNIKNDVVDKNNPLKGFLYENNLRVAFDIDKGATSTPNNAKITVYNLSIDSRISFENGGQVVGLKAGYPGLTNFIFIGDVRYVATKRNGADIETTFECGDGERLLVDTQINKSYPPQVSLAFILNDIVKNILGADFGIVIGIPTKSFNKGIVFSKSVKEALDTLLLTEGLSWSVQNGAIQVIPVDQDTGEEAILVSKETGLIGTPSMGKGNEFITFECLLNPNIGPGKSVFLKSDDRNFTGTFKINRAHFQGDSHGQKWQVACEAVRITKTTGQIFSFGDLRNIA